MNEVNRTLFIPLYGKSRISRRGIILNDPMAEKIWLEGGFPIHGRSGSRWLAYNMAMRARVFDRWAEKMLRMNKKAIVLHIGCGLDSRCMRVRVPYSKWVDCDLPDVIDERRKYFSETETYHLQPLDAGDPAQTQVLSDGDMAIVILEGISMYLPKNRLKEFLYALQMKYQHLHILMDVYTEFGAWASKYKNPVNDVGVTTLYGIDDINSVINGTRIRLLREKTFTPAALVKELPPCERFVFKLLFMGWIYRKIYRLYELEA